MKTTDNYKIGDRVKNISTGATGTIDNFLIDDEGKRTYIVKYDEIQRRPDSFEYQNEEVFAEEIELTPFFIAGKKYRCIKSVTMKKGGETAFKAGNIYEQTGEPTHWVGWLRNERGERHGWPQPVYIADTVKTWGSKPEDIDPRNYFEPVEDIKETEDIKVGDRVKVKNYDTPADVTAISEDGKYYTVKFLRPVRGFWTGDTITTATYSRYGITRNYDRMTGEEIVGNAQYYAEELQADYWEVHEPRTFRFDTNEIEVFAPTEKRQTWLVVADIFNEPKGMTLREVCDYLAACYQEEHKTA